MKTDLFEKNQLAEQPSRASLEQLEDLSFLTLNTDHPAVQQAFKRALQKADVFPCTRQ